MALLTTSEVRALLPYLTRQERAELDSLLASVPAYAALPFEEFCRRCLVVQNKEGQLVPLELNAVQRQLIASLTGRDLVLKARQVGISTVIQAWFFYHTVRGGERTSTLCHEDDLTQELRAMSDRFYENYPDDGRPARQYANAKLTTYPALNSQNRIATVGGTAGLRKGRGGSNTRMHGSEVAFWPDAQGVMAAAMQAGDPEIILESTPNGMRGWFYERCMEALSGEGVWTLHFFPWWHEPEYRLPLAEGEALVYTDDEQRLVDEHGLDAEQIKWRRYKLTELPHTFRQEYPEDPISCFIASGASYFGDVEHVFVAPKPAAPEAGHRYVGGLDFAQTGDYTVLMIVDATTARMVDMLRVNRESWQEMRRRISVMANRWDADVLGEANSMGKTNIELLRTGETLADGSKIAPMKLPAFDNTPAPKPPLIQGLYHALHEEGLTLQDDPVLRHELRAFQSKQTASGHWVYEGGEGAHDDTVIALALANKKRHAPSLVYFEIDA